ncbi:hypothetical protein PF005_g18018 [Phytophthora fragariae]|uniref:RxLR effector protein n=1 Tax=Phytophthora fragariae TaxID=53985 RepID=A0A6A4CX91_9STRA|nr:hypothetical protein PF003_g40844 [Phytophthora fragariae]KAE8945361.1 hypothetical protein PF009_g4986 [Phytophthora fragariae]KAE8993960.1 hypothetical protein PF011_g16926 [Phytophthora fragariae]KAE9127356.1 hypothetical protein PF006_g16526 [Phytophthora fragariae]KAE9128619.1 hypothetical protein PF007_g5200 [Phytophthora fragariae]
MFGRSWSVGLAISQILLIPLHHTDSVTATTSHTTRHTDSVTATTSHTTRHTDSVTATTSHTSRVPGGVASG